MKKKIKGKKGANFTKLGIVQIKAYIIKSFKLDFELLTGNKFIYLFSYFWVGGYKLNLGVKFCVTPFK